MRRITEQPLPLLLITGSLVGINFPLGKLAGAANIPPLVWSLLISAGAACILAIALLVRRQPLPLGARHVRYYLVAGIISYALPNLLVFTVIPRLGAGFTSILFTFSPILTLILASVMKTRRPNAWGMAGIGLGFAGALMVVLSKGQLDAPAQPEWVAIAFLIPLALAIGNIYRTMDWPTDAAGLPLAVGTNLAAALFLCVVTVLSMGRIPAQAALASPVLVLVQVTLSSAMFAVFFQLQRVGGPVYLSQIGYVAAAVGLASGSLLLGETYGVLTWLGAVVVTIAVFVTTRAQQAAGS